MGRLKALKNGADEGNPTVALLRSLSLPLILAAGNLILLLVSLRDCSIFFLLTLVILYGIFCEENNFQFKLISRKST